MSNNPNNLWLGGMTLKANATLPGADPDKAASYSIDFGNITKSLLKTEADRKEHFGTYGGALKRDRIFTVKRRMSYEVTCDELSPALLAYFLGSASGAAPDPGKIFSLYFWAAFEMPGEEVNTTDDDAIFMHHSFRGDLSVVGDLNMDPENFAELKLVIDVDLGTPGLWLADTRPHAAS